MTHDDTLNHWIETAHDFKGDKALFWAGRLSITIGMINSANISDLSDIIKLANECKEIYDTIIFDRVK